MNSPNSHIHDAERCYSLRTTELKNDAIIFKMILDSSFCIQTPRIFSKSVYTLKNISNYTVSGEGNGTPLQYSCLENPMDGGAWWAAVHGVAKSRTRLKRLSSSSSILSPAPSIVNHLYSYTHLLPSWPSKPQIFNI